MSATKELIKKYYENFNAKNFEGMISLLTDDAIHDTNQGERSVGKDVFRSFMKDMDRCYDENLTDLVIMTNDEGTRASAEFVIHGVYKVTAEGLPPANGQKYVLPVGCFFDIKGGKIARVTNYYNLNDWLKMVK